MDEFDKGLQSAARRNRPRDSFEKGRLESEEGKSFGNAKSKEFQTVKNNKIPFKNTPFTKNWKIMLRFPQFRFLRIVFQGNLLNL